MSISETGEKSGVILFGISQLTGGTGHYDGALYRYRGMNESDPDTIAVDDLVPGVDLLVTEMEPENGTLVYGMRIGLEFPPLRRP
jgi:hypothetical protein